MSQRAVRHDPDRPVVGGDPAAEAWRGRVALGLTLLALVPVLATVATRAGRAYLPGGDVALIDLRARHLLDDLPLVGVYSRFGWNHPGPVIFYLLAPLNRLFGGASWSTLVGAALVQGAAIALTARLAWRRGGLTLVALVLGGLMLGYLALGHLALLTPWNPYVAFPFLALFVLLVWSVGCGDRWKLVGATIVGSILVQLHFGYAPLIGAAAVWLLVVLVRDRGRGDQSPYWRAVVAVAAVSAFILWLPPLVDEASDSGNLTHLARYALEGHQVAGVEVGAGLLAAQFRMPPPWLGGGDLVEPLGGTAGTASLWWLLVPTLLLAAAYVVARRAGAVHAMRLVGLMSVLALAGLVALSRVDGPLEPYVFFWRALLATFVVAAAAWATRVAWPWSIEDWRTRVALVAAFAAVAAPAIALTVDIVRHPRDVNPFENSNRAIIRAVSGTGDVTKPFIVRDAGTAYQGLSGALVDELDRRGDPVRLDERLEPVIGSRLAARTDEVASIWYVAENGTDVSILTGPSAAKVLARTTPLTPAQERELVRLQRSLAAKLDRMGRRDLFPALEYSVFALLLDDVPGVDRASVNRLRALNRRVELSGRCRCAVVAYPPDVRPPTTAVDLAATR